MSTAATTSGLLALRYTEMRTVVEKAVRTLQELLPQIASTLRVEEGYSILFYLGRLFWKFVEPFVSDGTFLKRLAERSDLGIRTFWRRFSDAHEAMRRQNPFGRNASVDTVLAALRDVKDTWWKLLVAAEQAVNFTERQDPTYVQIRGGEAVFFHPAVGTNDESNLTAGEHSAEGQSNNFFDISMLSASDGKERLNDFIAQSESPFPTSSSASVNQAEGYLAAEQGSVQDPRLVLLGRSRELSAMIENRRTMVVEAAQAESEDVANWLPSGSSDDGQDSSRFSGIPLSDGSVVTFGEQRFTEVTPDSLESMSGFPEASLQSLAKNLHRFTSVLSRRPTARSWLPRR
jgi:hypothetical protein